MKQLQIYVGAGIDKPRQQQKEENEKKIGLKKMSADELTYGKLFRRCNCCISAD